MDSPFFQQGSPIDVLRLWDPLNLVNVEIPETVTRYSSKSKDLRIGNVKI